MAATIGRSRCPGSIKWRIAATSWQPSARACSTAARKRDQPRRLLVEATRSSDACHVDGHGAGSAHATVDRRTQASVLPGATAPMRSIRPVHPACAPAHPGNAPDRAPVAVGCSSVHGEQRAALRATVRQNRRSRELRPWSPAAAEPSIGWSARAHSAVHRPWGS